MVYSHHLHRNTGIVDPLLFSEDSVDSYFWYHGYKTIKNFFIVRKDITPQETTNSSFGSKNTWKIPILADKWGKVQLMFQVGPLATTGGTFRRFVDFLGYTAWDYIELAFSTNEVYTIFPEDIWKKYRTMLGIEHREAEAEIIASDKSNAERDFLATQTQQMIVDLVFPHCRASTHWMEIMQLAQEPRITVQWKPLANIVNTDGTNPTATLSDVKMRCVYVHFDNDERDNNTFRVEQEDGVIRLFDDFKMEQSPDIPIGTTGEYRIKINNFRTSTKTFSFIVRRKVDLTTPLANNYFGNLQQIGRFWLEGADGRIIEPIEDLYSRFHMWTLHHESPAGEFLYEYPFGLEPDNLLDSSGSYNFGNATNITLVIDFGSFVTEDILQVTMMANEYNTHQHVRGDVQKNFK